VKDFDSSFKPLVACQYIEDLYFSALIVSASSYLSFITLLYYHSSSLSNAGVFSAEINSKLQEFGHFGSYVALKETLAATYRCA
jgi:hypothetical protein